MATLTTTRNYDDGEVLVRADLDAFLDDIETFLNVTKINDDNIQNSGITGSTKLLNQSVTESKLAADAVTTLKIADSAVTTAKIADTNVTTAKIANDAVTADKLADDASVDVNRAVTTNHIRDLAVTTAKIANDAVTADKLADDASVDANRAVTTNHIRDAAVTTAKINDGAVTSAKLAARHITATVNQTVSTTSDVDLGSITVAGRPVVIAIDSGAISTSALTTASWTLRLARFDGSTETVLHDFYTQSSGSPGTGTHFTFTLPQVFNAQNPTGGTQDGVSVTKDAASAGWASAVFLMIDVPAAGTYTYRFKVNRSAGSLTFSSVRILIYEV